METEPEMKFSMKPFCPLCEKFLYDPQTEVPRICGKHLLDDDVKLFFERVTAAINTIIAEVDSLKEALG
jgi:hypothetical protein